MAYIFLDESGIHKKDGISAVVLIYVDNKDVGILESEVINLEKIMRINPFHWSDHNWNFRRKFLEGTARFNFSAKLFISANPFSEPLYQKALSSLLVGESIDCIVMDGKKSRHYQKRYKHFLRNNGIHLKKLVLGNDKSYPILRIADSYAGLLRSYYENPQREDARNLFERIKQKITVTNIL